MRAALARVRLRREHSQLLTENLEFAKSQALYRQGLQILGDARRRAAAGPRALGARPRRPTRRARRSGSPTRRGSSRCAATAASSIARRSPARIDPEGPRVGAAPRPPRAERRRRREGRGRGLPRAAPRRRGAGRARAPLRRRSRPRSPPEQHAAALTVADFTAIAVKNARRFQALERIGLRDRDTGAYNLAYFIDYAGKEFYKARRYGRAFSLVVLSIDNAEQMRKEGGRELYRRATRDLVSAVSRVVRDADILAKVSESEYYVLLPETDYFGALMFLRRAAEEVRREDSIRELERRCPVLLSMGAATFPKDGEDFDELLHWARARVQEQRGSLLRRLHLGDVRAERVLGARRSPPLRVGADPGELTVGPPRLGAGAVRRGAARGGARDRPRPARARPPLRRARASGSPDRAGRGGAPAGRRRGPRRRHDRARVPARSARGRRGDRRAPARHRGLRRRRPALRRPRVPPLHLGALRLRAPLAGRAAGPSTPPTRRSWTRSSSKLQTLYDLQPL